MLPRAMASRKGGVDNSATMAAMRQDLRLYSRVRWGSSSKVARGGDSGVDESLHDLADFGPDLEHARQWPKVEYRGRWYTYVPPDERRQLLWSFHAPAHQGVRTLQPHLTRFTWPNKRLDVKRFLSNCLCASKKQKVVPAKAASAPAITLEASYPLECVSVDCFDYADRSYLTMVDHFSGFPFAFALPDKTASSVTAQLENWISIFAEPKKFLSDQGGEFNEVHTLAQHVVTAAYRPMANGKLERLHREITHMCRVHKCDPVQALWYLRTDDMRNKLYQFIAFPPNNMGLSYADKTRLRLQEMLHSFRPGDFVLRFVHPRGRRKPDDSYKGPYVVKSLVSDRTVIIGSYDRRSTDVKVHCSDLKPIHLPDSSTWKLNPSVLRQHVEEWRRMRYLPGSDVVNLPALTQDALLHALNLSSSSTPPTVFVDIVLHDDSIKATYDFFVSNTQVKHLLVVVPELPCLPFWAQHHTWHAKWVKLDMKEDTFVGGLSNTPVGIPTFTYWLACFHRPEG
jgi:hypothetical protein